MAASGDRIKILIGILAATLVSFLIASVIVKSSKTDEQSVNKELKEAAKQMEALKGKKSRISSVFEDKEEALDYASIRTILYVCDAGLGSSAMGASVVAKKLKKIGIEDIKVPHARVIDLPQKADVIITHNSLKDIVHEKQPDITVIAIEDYLNAPEYDDLVNKIVEARGKK